MRADPSVLASVRGYLVADIRGRMVGRVESASSEGRLTVRGRLPRRRRSVVPASSIEEIDSTSGVISLNVEREALGPA